MPPKKNDKTRRRNTRQRADDESCTLSMYYISLKFVNLFMYQVGVTFWQASQQRAIES